MSDWDDGRTPPTTDKPTIGRLVEQLSEQATRLVRSEIALAKTELTTKATRAGLAIGLFVAAAVLLLYALGFLLHAAMSGLATALPLWLAGLIVGVALVLVAVVLGLVGRSQLKKGIPPTPESATRNIKEDIATVKEGLHP
ncbi:phage holin family protein [Oerskovia flava]|uniref:phage holin family protein n=1 Tax=Oerskovia flava TaxID=2986422 RepID=UPI0022408FC5|nr:phage holin family protein [Oerskovia sp. JB1-3-2]